MANDPHLIPVAASHATCAAPSSSVYAQARFINFRVRGGRPSTGSELRRMSGSESFFSAHTLAYANSPLPRCGIDSTLINSSKPRVASTLILVSFAFFLYLCFVIPSTDHILISSFFSSFLTVFVFRLCSSLFAFALSSKKESRRTCMTTLVFFVLCYWQKCSICRCR